VARASERLSYAVDLLDLRPDDRVLELGCGHGVAVSLVCQRLDGGRITAIDRSAKMIAAARQRNAAEVEAGTATFVEVSLDAADFGHARFDKVFGVHFPPLLRGDPTRELDVIRGCLAPGGTLYAIFQPLTADQAEDTVERITSAFDANGFRVEDVDRRAVAPAPVVSVAAGLADQRTTS
jgi:cyclopropane fatty-acyl-phospholipid synthase-like methyltransferase